MKRKCLLILTFLVLAIILSGCAGGIVTPLTDEAKIESVISEYFLAMNDQNWSKAKSYCVYGSERYYDTCSLEDFINALYQYYSIVTITFQVTIYNVYVYGNYAQADINVNFWLAYGYYSDVDSTPTTYDLQKIGNPWKIL